MQNDSVDLKQTKMQPVADFLDPHRWRKKFAPSQLQIKCLVARKSLTKKLFRNYRKKKKKSKCAFLKTIELKKKTFHPPEHSENKIWSPETFPKKGKCFLVKT